MAKHVAVNFENGIVRIVYASLSRGKLSVKNTITLKNEEFDDFLRKEKTRNFTVVCDFKTIYQFIAVLPAVKESYLKKIIESEIRNRYLELRDFSYFHIVLGEITSEVKKMQEVFIFAVNNDDVSQIIERFSSHNKTISSLHTNSLVLSRLVQAKGDLPDDPVLCVSESGETKTLFMIKGGKLLFVRDVQSLTPGIHDFDVENLNMTINYCRQTLRASPTMLIGIGSVMDKYDATQSLILPMVGMENPSNVKAPKETIMEFIVPIAAILYSRELKWGNLLLKSYRDFLMQKAFLKYCTAAFAFFFIAGLGYFAIKTTEVAALKNDIDLLRAELTRAKTIQQSYEIYKKELENLTPLAGFINAINTTPDFQKCLVALSVFGGKGMKDINVQSIRITPEGGAFRFSMKGDISANTYLVTHSTFRHLREVIKKTSGMELSSDRLDLHSRKFEIEARYRSN
ncbi:MAG: hypothetical protein C0415_01495 [Thermodesulfovibrio sp.]|nr:hypothetical protein [Thermodesulfovibrio sp.]